MRLEQALHEAETRAEPVRYGLLYGTGDELKRAVAHVLTDAGLRTVDLDEQLGGTRSSDLLVTAGGAPGWSGTSRRRCCPRPGTRRGPAGVPNSALVLV